MGWKTKMVKLIQLHNLNVATDDGESASEEVKKVMKDILNCGKNLSDYFWPVLVMKPQKDFKNKI